MATLALFFALPVSAEALTSAEEAPEGEPERAPSSVDVRASQFPGSTKDHVAIDVDAAGRTVAVWQSRRQQSGTYGIYARRFDADGSPLGEELQVNTTTRSHQTAPSVALDADGTAWIVWNSHGQDGSQGTIVARRFDANFESASAEIVVNTHALGDQRDARIDSDDDGNAVIVWTSPVTGETGRHVFARRMQPDAKAGGDAFRVNTATSGSNSLPSLSMAANGDFTVAWAHVDGDGDPDGIFARCFDARGKALAGAAGAELRVSPDDRGAAIEPSIARVNETRFVVAWLEGTADDYRLVHRSFELEVGCEVVASETRSLATPDSGYISGATVAANSKGDLAFAWNRFAPEPRKSDLYLASFASDGSVLRAPFVATRATDDHQGLAQANGTRMLVLGTDGRMTVAWSGEAELGDSHAAHLSLHAAVGQTLVASAERVKPTKTFDQPAQPHQPPTFQPVTDIAPVDRTPQYHALTGLVGFPGVVNTGWTPPDPDLAVGPNHLVQVTNGAIAYFQKDGTLDFQDEIEDSFGFWGGLGADGFVFDPEVRYDPHSDRFFAMACERSDTSQPFFLLAVSDDSNPNGPWFKYRINVQAAAGDNDIDSPNMGIDAQAVYLTADFFGPDKFLVFVVDKAPLLSGGPVSSTSTVLNGQQSLGVPVTYPGATRQYMIWSPESGTSNSIQVFAINNPLSSPSLVSTSISVPSFTQPEDPPQMGSSARPETFESRFWSCVYRNGSLWATHHVNSTRVRQRWYEIDMANWPVSGTPTLVQSGEIDPGPGIRTFFGSIAVDASDNMGITFARSATDERISMGYAWRQAGDPLGTTRPMVIAKNSSNPNPTNRWGDYSGIGPDPVQPNVFWAAHEYYEGVWRTWIQSFTTGDLLANYCVTSPNSAGPGATISSSGSTSVAANDLVLIATGAPASIQGLFFFGFNEIQNPLGNGWLCAGGGVQRLPVTPTGPLGSASFNLNLNSSQVGGAITAGTTAKFQYWYRDPGVGANFNLSDGLSATFVP